MQYDSDDNKNVASQSMKISNLEEQLKIIKEIVIVESETAGAMR